MAKKLATILAFMFLASTSFAASTRTIDADLIRSSDATKTFTLPSSSGTLMSSGSYAQDSGITGAVNGVNLTFTLSFTPTSIASVTVFIDGLAQIQATGQDYTISGTTITMVTAPATGQKIYATYTK